MNAKHLAVTLIALGSTLSGPKAIAQATMKNGFLNVQMRTALCAQNWPRAIQVLDTMQRISPKDRTSLEQYRSFLVNFRDNETRIFAWPPSEYCSGASSALPNPAATPNGNPTSATPITPPAQSDPGTRPETVPTF
ncbi:MAG: hypothetical protein VKJ86_01330 [Synechococcus sp.]|nr:hypothetical protein [Synechococcus sp.]